MGETTNGRGFVDAVEIDGSDRVLFCSGQLSIDAEGNAVHTTMREQALQALSNVEAVLEAAGFELGHVVRLTIHTTDAIAYREVAAEVDARLVAAGASYAATMVGIDHLAMPELLVELEVVAAQRWVSAR